MHDDLETMSRRIAELSEAQQAELAADIPARLHGRLPATDAAWAEEAARRYDEIKRGEMETIPASDVLAEARVKLASLK